MIEIIPQIFVVLKRSMIQCDCLNEGFSLRTLICSKLVKRSFETLTKGVTRRTFICSRFSQIFAIDSESDSCLSTYKLIKVSSCFVCATDFKLITLRYVDEFLLSVQDIRDVFKSLYMM